MKNYPSLTAHHFLVMSRWLIGKNVLDYYNAKFKTSDRNCGVAECGEIHLVSGAHEKGC